MVVALHADSGILIEFLPTVLSKADRPVVGQVAVRGRGMGSFLTGWPRCAVNEPLPGSSLPWPLRIFVFNQFAELCSFRQLDSARIAKR